MNLIKRYRFFMVTLVALVAMFIWDRPNAFEAFDALRFSLKEMILVIPPIFILLGLLDVWVPKETMARFMGEGSGLKGVLLAFFIGSAAAGPLYGAFPVAGVFMRKGVSFFNILIFIGAWSTTKIPMFLFELAALGPQFAWTRLVVNIPGILLIAWALSKLISAAEKEALYRQSELLR